ncbi:hypothetical protein [Novipirellula artificiosorum]|uniref:Uncharacterized protein n=1 Tax=Novipirellula artificiosorum TaxID=2528016 RepID=A0A5C6DS99_9BACT|nr:hypothetical protein [Novipirellula artificiosorum]TWU39552.1 hypothetical protein Poly41_24070 [Novipirellula artificiosorum]
MRHLRADGSGVDAIVSTTLFAPAHIGDKVYYQHFAPAEGRHASKNQIGSKPAIDGALIDALKAKAAGYTLLLGSHGIGKAGIEDLEFQINYLETLRQIAAKANTADELVAEMKAAYPDCSGEEDLQGIAAKLYPAVSADRSEANKKAALVFFPARDGRPRLRSRREICRKIYPARSTYWRWI